MKYRRLGRTGVEVGEIAHGLWGMSGWSGSDDHQSLEALQLAVDLGCNFFDTAWAYGEGKSDALLGKILSANRGKRLYAASKIPPFNNQWPASPKDKYRDVFPSEHVFQYAKLIREKLGTDSIDLLQFHVWDDSWAGEVEFRDTVERLKRDGWIRFFGLSLNRWQPENGIRAMRTGLVDVVQVIYNIFDQSPEDKLFPACRELNIGVIARVPLDDSGNQVSRERLAIEILQPGKSQANAGTGGETEAGDSQEHKSAGRSVAVYPVGRDGEYDYRRNEEAGSRPAKHCDERCRAAPRRTTSDSEEAPLGSHAAALVRLAWSD
jgi:aryl-alcohol dehydrogenase-like predicted oxidoreductase